MSRKILINALDSDENRIATIKDNKLEQFHIDTSAKQVTQGNIYKAIVTSVAPSLQAVFVEYGAKKNGFLQMQEIHSDYFQDNESGKKKLSSLIKKGQELIVQVIKDPIAHKGAMLSTYISLPGRLVVLMPGNTTKGVSRQIDDEKERKRLATIAGNLKIPPGFGLIVRTVGKGANKTMLTHDLRYLMRIWKSIDKKAVKQKAPSLLYKEQDLAVRTLRDYFTNDIQEILIDDQAVFKKVKDFISIIAPKSTKKVKKFNSDKPIFTKYQLEDQIGSIYKKKVSLPSGGELVIDQTEALVAIDVNSGKSTKKKNIEETAFHTNIEAAEEVARQLRLRDLGGLIVIDFIDMREKKHKSEVTKKIKFHLKSDKAKTKVGGLSQFGLLEMSRQRLRPAITFGSFESCSYCDGRGQVPSIKSQTIAFLRQINLKSLKKEITNLTGIVPENVASYLLNKKRDELINIETKHNVTISIEGDRKINAGESKIIIDGQV
ncbi:MAG: Rne/Rng family ribonuclease [Desulfobacteraceae bacterium]|nr:Rne/Rng family ribonuclease [Desulfobacteraceae bacterium]